MQVCIFPILLFVNNISSISGGIQCFTPLKYLTMILFYKARNSLLVIDSSIEEKFPLRDEFDVSDEGKELQTLKNIRRNDKTPITHMSVDILNRDFGIEELSNKREIFSNDLSNIKRYKFKL